MKKNILLSIATALALSACSPKMSPGIYSGYVRYDGTPTVGIVSLTTTGFGKNQAESSEDAMAGAFYTLLFKGVPGSAYELPMVPHEDEKKNDPTIVELLNGGFHSFVTADVLQNQEIMVKKNDGVKGKMTTHLVSINCDALRRHLEQHAVISKFGL